MRSNSLITIILAVGIICSTRSQEKRLNNQILSRNIDLAGILIDSKTLLPIENAIVYDENDSILTSTNKEGYFKTRLTCFNSGEIEFKFRIESEGYYSFVQKEHWGDLGGKINAIYYVGLQSKDFEAKAFSKLISIYGNLSFEAIHKNYRKIKEQEEFKNKVAIAKKGNEHVFFKIEDNFYIINNTGWIKINSKDDLISMNNDKNILAQEINLVIKRKDVTGMSPTDSKKVPFAISTK